MSLSSLMPFNFSSASKAAPNVDNAATKGVEAGSDFSEELQHASANSDSSLSKAPATKNSQSNTSELVSEDAEHSLTTRGNKLTAEQVDGTESAEHTAEVHIASEQGDAAAIDSASLDETTQTTTSNQQVSTVKGNDLTADEATADKITSSDVTADEVAAAASVGGAATTQPANSTIGEHQPQSQTKQQTMTEGEAFLSQMDAANKQLPTKESNTKAQPLAPPSTQDADGNSLPAGAALAAGQALNVADAGNTDTAALQGQEGSSDKASLAHVFTAASTAGTTTALNTNGAANVTQASVTSSEAEAAVNATASGATEASQAIAASGVIGVAAANNVHLDPAVEGVSSGVSDGATDKVAGQASGAAALANSANTGAATSSSLVNSIPWSSNAVTTPTAMDSIHASSAQLAGGLAVGAGIATASGDSSTEIDYSAAMLAGGVAATSDGQPDPTARTSGSESTATASTVTAGSLTMQQAAKAEAIAQAQVPIQLSKEQGGDELAEKVNIMMSKNLKHVDIRLDPPELGKVQIKLSMNQDQASIQFTAANAQTRELLEHSMPRLRELMQQQGVQLAQTSVQQDTSRQQTAGQPFSGQQGQQANGQGSANSGQQSGASGHGSGHGNGQGEGHWGTADGESLEMYATPANDRVDYYA
ncbi:flagellar hook-length control protein FliK [Photobacterium swingsii]|uniref:flagellar hook-length control protein FliK n=1 Tax=Photobacterium swingsii TaxID=680026 RepID=UPI003551F8B1